MVTWQRKAQACGLHLFPVPTDPFALPYSCNSDPLRGPILVPLSVSCLTLSGSEPFAQFPADTWDRRMHLFQVMLWVISPYLVCKTRFTPCSICCMFLLRRKLIYSFSVSFFLFFCQVKLWITSLYLVCKARFTLCSIICIYL